MTRMLEVDGVTHHFGGVRAVHDARFDVATGEVVGLIGPNGAGKTTMFNLISGAVGVQHGSIRFRGEEISGLRPDQITHRGMGRTFQTPKLFDGMTAGRNVRLALLYGTPKRRHGHAAVASEIDRLLERTGLAHRRDTDVRDLSLAERRKLEITRALATGAELLLLDEVMAGLTPGELAESMQLIEQLRSEGTTVLMIEHVMHAIMNICDRVVVLHFGETIIEGTPREVVADPTVRSVYLGEE